MEHQSRISYEVSCIWCEKLHRAEHPFKFNPVCPTCAARYLTGALEMNGSYPLNNQTIDELVSRTSPGNYALGYMDGTTFMVSYVGRSDSDVRRRLHEWVGPRPVPVLAYTRFAFSYSASANAAFEKECRNYHDFGGSDGLDNDGHPEPIPGGSWRCPIHDR